MHWVIDSIYLEREPRRADIEATLSRQGHMLTILGLSDLIAFPERLPDHFFGACGSIGFMKQLAWLPEGRHAGHFFAKSLWQYSDYQPRLPNLPWLNPFYLMAPLQHILAAPHRWGALLDAPDWWIKPNSGLKLFEARVIDRHSASEQLAELAGEGVDPTTLCLIAPTADILAEYRFVVADGKVIAGSQYLLGKDIAHAPWGAIPEKAIDLARLAAAADWVPDRMFVVDVAKCPSGFKLIEYNALSTSGLYLCDPEPIFREASRILTEEGA